MLDTAAGTTDAPAPTPVRRRWPTRLALLVPSAVTLVLGLWGLGRENAMGNDEVATRWVSGLPLRAMAHVLHRLDAVHGLYYLLIHCWMVFGRSPTDLRVPSLLAMAAAMVVVSALARRLTGSTLAGLAAGLVAAGTPSTTFYAQTARSYAIVYLVVAFATLALVRALEQDGTAGRARWLSLWLPYAGAIVLAGYLNELSLLVLGAHLVTVLCARRGWAVTGRWFAASVVSVLLVSPLVAISRGQSMVLDYLRPPDGDDLLVLFHTFFGGTTVVAVLVAVVAAVAVVGAVTRPVPGAVSPVTVALPLLVVPAGLLLAWSEVAEPIYADRYVLFGEIGVAVLAGAGLERLATRAGSAGRAVTPAIVVVGCAAVLVGQVGSQRAERLPQSRQFDFGGPAQVVGSGARPGDGVLFFDSFYRRTRLGYPADFRDTTDLALSEPPARAASFRGTDKPLFEIRPLMLGYRRIWVVGRVTPDSGPGVRGELAVLERHFTRAGGQRFGRIHVTLWRRA